MAIRILFYFLSLCFCVRIKLKGATESTQKHTHKEETVALSLKHSNTKCPCWGYEFLAAPGPLLAVPGEDS